MRAHQGFPHIRPDRGPDTTRLDQNTHTHTHTDITPYRMGAWGITGQGPGAMPKGQGPGHPAAKERDTPDHTTGSVCSVPRFWLQADPSSRPRAQPRLISRPLPSRGGVMQCGKATSQEGKDVHAVSRGKGCGIECCCSCARTSPSYSRLSDPTSDDRKLGEALGKGNSGTWRQREEEQQASKQAGQGTFCCHQPAPAIPAQHVFLLLLPVIHSRRVGEARQGNVRQCKARQGNKAVLVHAPPRCSCCYCHCYCHCYCPRPNCCFWHEGGTRTTTTRRHNEQASCPGCLALPHAGHRTRLEPGPPLPLPRFRAVVWAWTACSRIIRCVNHALPFSPP